MSQERADEKDKASRDWYTHRKFEPEETQEIKSISLEHLHPLNHQITSLSKDFEFQWQQSCWFYFNRGLFWGIVVGFTVLFSASCGVALTRIDAIEKAIAQTFDLNSSSMETGVKPSLTRPINLLLLEIEPNLEEENNFSQGLIGDSQTILLLQFIPQENIAKVIHIPTDNLVEIPGFGWGTIGDAYRYGGVVLLSQTIAQITDGITIDRYVQGTSSTFDKLISSGKITFNDCSLEINECRNPQKRIVRQRKALETIRQRFNIPTYFRSFKISLERNREDLDTNLSIPEAISLANFVKELEPENVMVNLVANYTPGDIDNINNRLYKSGSIAQKSNQLDDYNNLGFKHRSVAVQNTTDSPEIGMGVVDYLRSQNFQDVYLVEHIPLRLNKTKIIINQSQLARAKHLQKVMGFGTLEPKSDNMQNPLTIQVGKDADHLPLHNLDF